MSAKILDVIQNFLWPIKRHELKKFFPMAFMLFFILFNYSVLRVLKDSLVIPALGAEAVSFIKSYFVVPCAVVFALLYAKMTNLMNFNRIFFSISAFYLVYFIFFGLVIYPHQEFFHPSSYLVNKLIHEKYDLYFFSIDMDHFKWFIIIFGKWSFVLNYILAELWGSSMIFLLFWQFANQTVKTEEAKRFYPMFGLIGHAGALISGYLLKYFAHNSVTNYYFFGMVFDDSFTASVLVSAFIALLMIIAIFYYINYVAEKETVYITKAKRPEMLKSKLSIRESIKVIMSSKYLGYIVVLIFSYGIAINLVEGVWKDRARALYSNTVDYAGFSSDVIVYTGYSAMFFMLAGANIFKYFGWLTAALITPITIFITGILFFLLVVFSDTMYANVAAMTIVNPLFLTVFIGTIQNVLSKGTKYALFDSTKEMSYIPLNQELKSKGKAAVDVIGARFAKSGGAHVQSLIFMIFPSATYTSIAPYLMVVFSIVMIIWLLDVKLLYKAYTLKLSKSKS
ncbi:MAG: Npt1/Npt2 family nucleotide transporter [Rickettsiales bacterium]